MRAPERGAVGTLRLAAAMAADLDGQRRREDQAFREGFEIGYSDGWEIGYRQAHEEMARDWLQIAERVRRMANTPTFAELQERRYGKREVA